MFLPCIYSLHTVYRNEFFAPAVVITRGIGLALVHSTETVTPVESAVFLPKPCSTLQLRTVQNSGNNHSGSVSKVATDVMPWFY